jgi:hypothetical protein
MSVQAFAYGAVNAPILDEAPRSAHRAFDVGCGLGVLGKQSKETRQTFVIGLTWSDGGRMDRTQLSVFDWKTTRELVATAGSSIVRLGLWSRSSSRPVASAADWQLARQGCCELRQTCSANSSSS